MTSPRFVDNDDGDDDIDDTTMMQMTRATTTIMKSASDLVGGLATSMATSDWGDDKTLLIQMRVWHGIIFILNLGGGEAPKSLSGRVLVAAYWLFVVLMLATFTANLAAFLTVER